MCNYRFEEFMCLDKINSGTRKHTTNFFFYKRSKKYEFVINFYLHL